MCRDSRYSSENVSNYLNAEIRFAARCLGGFFWHDAEGGSA